MTDKSILDGLTPEVRKRVQDALEELHDILNRDLRRAHAHMEYMASCRELEQQARIKRQSRMVKLTKLLTYF